MRMERLSARRNLRTDNRNSSKDINSNSNDAYPSLLNFS